MPIQALLEARKCLETVTPLLGDCGQVCGGACCRSLPGEETGMLLFPGEEALMATWPGAKVAESPLGKVFFCGGQCQRENRPLSCRVFPLLPVLRPDGVKVATDLRARAVCPLARQGKDALQTDFVQAVRNAGEILARDPVQRTFLEKLTAQQDDLRALHRQFGR